LLAHVGNELWEFQGWNQQWRVLIGSTGLLKENLTSALRPGRFPTQFVATPAGVVIIPQTGRALFYDGEVLAGFGYRKAPSAPSVSWIKSNSDQLKHDSNGGGPSELPFFATELFGLGATMRTTDGSILISGGGVELSQGHLQQALYTVATRWIDRWGNLSPIGHRLRISIPHEESGAWNNGVFEVDRALKVVGLSGIERGSDHTVGRIVCQSKDLRSSGDPGLYELPGQFPSAWATIPENVSEHYSLSHSDMELGLPVVDTLPVPNFRLGQMAMSRFWAGNVQDDRGRLMGSLPGLWGTFPADMVRYPDPQGAELTGLWPFQDGLLACTASSTFWVMEGDDGKGLRVQPLSRLYGCGAPSSFATMPDGTPVWWAGDQFVALTEKGPRPISRSIARRLSRLNHSRSSQAVAYVDKATGEYRCWLASGGSDENDLCFTFDGQYWRERPGERVSCLATLQQPPGYTVAGGRIESGNSWDDGVWVLDHKTPGHTASPIPYIFESVWFQRAPNATHQSPLRLMLWLREERESNIDVSVYRDYREGVDTLTSATITSQSTSDPPPRWGETALGSAPRWQRRRFFWTRKSIAVPSCESFKVKLSSTSPFAIMALEFDGIDHMGRMRTEGS